MNPADSPTEAPADAPETARPPLARALLWALLVAVMAAVAVAALLSGSWLEESKKLPVLGEVPEFSLTNRDGRTVTREDLAGRIWVTDFVFTRCPGICPAMTARMAKLQGELSRSPKVQLVSVSVDPAHDTPPVLEDYARRHGAEDRWLFLTGEPDAVTRLVRDGFHLGYDPAPPQGGTEPLEPIVHSNRFVLVDGQARIRGYYDSFDAEAMETLLVDVKALKREKSLR